MYFADRSDAGRALAGPLQRYRADAPVVVAVARGGIPVAVEVARSLAADFEVFVVRRVPAPGRAELSVGAVTEGGALYVDPVAAAHAGVTAGEVRQAAGRELDEARRQAALFRSAPMPSLTGRTVLLVDDGVTTGSTIRAAIETLSDAKPKWMVVAVPVAASGAAAMLKLESDDFVCLQEVPALSDVSEAYRANDQLDDGALLAAIARAPHEGM